jgi:hypothetical protein
MLQQFSPKTYSRIVALRPRQPGRRISRATTTCRPIRCLSESRTRRQTFAVGFLREHRIKEGSQNAGYFFGTISPNGPWINIYSDAPAYSLQHYIDFVSFIREHCAAEAEVDRDLANAKLNGDILYRVGATDEECSVGLAKLLHDEFGIDAVVAFRHVPRKVIVLHGHWKFKALPQAPASSDMPQPCIELFGNYALDKNSKLTSSSQTGRPRVARNFGDQFNEQVEPLNNLRKRFAVWLDDGGAFTFRLF